MTQSPELVAMKYATKPDPEIVARATALVPLIREKARQGNEARRVTPEVIEALEEAGLFRMLLPKRLGGLETNIQTAIEATAEVSRGDGSTGWVTALMTLATGFSSTFSEACQQELFQDGNTPRICGVFSPGDTSKRVDGGYLISGKWPYASGSFAANWASLTITLEDGQPGTALVPKEAFTIEPSWFVAGMKGTGSDTVVVEEHFVPDHRIQPTNDMMNSKFRTHLPDEYMAQMPFNAVAAAVLVAPQIGLGRHALEITREKLPNKRVAYTAYPAAKESPTHQISVAQAASKLHLAELLLKKMCEDMHDAAVGTLIFGTEEKVRLRHDTGLVAELVNEQMRFLMTANGAGAFADANVLSTIWKDSETASRHALVTTEIGREAYGRILLGNLTPITSH